ncbi:hypothetical protein HIM_03294 [Hirsutella minnesotensis 3608]|nr:hypothetical protein HIM_03294 [Hirsutella minnesotensis 3608]
MPRRSRIVLPLGTSPLPNTAKLKWRARSVGRKKSSVTGDARLARPAKPRNAPRKYGDLQDRSELQAELILALSSRSGSELEALLIRLRAIDLSTGLGEIVDFIRHGEALVQLSRTGTTVQQIHPTPEPTSLANSGASASISALRLASPSPSPSASDATVRHPSELLANVDVTVASRLRAILEAMYCTPHPAKEFRIKYRWH